MGNIRELRNKTIAKKMRYPEHEAANQWYMFTLPGAPVEKEGKTTKKYSSAWICIGHTEQPNSWHDLGSVNLQDTEFKRKWYALLATGKERVDAMNSQPLDGELLCAECGDPALPGDFLCQEHRT